MATPNQALNEEDVETRRAAPNRPEPDELAEEIIDNLEAELNGFGDVLAGLAKAS